MDLVADLVSEDAQRIWQASCVVRTLRDHQQLQALIASLPQIRAKAIRVPLGGALRPNSSHLEFAIRKLKFIQAHPKKCFCSLYRLDDLYDPNREAEAGHVRCLAMTVEAERNEALYTCECVLCGAGYEVFEHEYHYRWWEWHVA